MQDFRTQLMSLLAEGNAIVQTVESDSFIRSLAKAVAPYAVEREDLEDLEEFVESLDLSSPIHQIYMRYIKWNRDCESVLANSGLSKSLQFREFVRLRREVAREIAKKSPFQRAILLKIKEQLATLDSLQKVNIEQLREETRPKATPKRSSKRSKRWIQRNERLLLTLFYVFCCVAFDALLFPIITVYVIGLIAVEVTILLGIPKLLEWLKES